MCCDIQKDTPTKASFIVDSFEILFHNQQLSKEYIVPWGMYRVVHFYIFITLLQMSLNIFRPVIETDFCKELQLQRITGNH